MISSSTLSSNSDDDSVINPHAAAECHPCTIHGLYCYSIASSLFMASDATPTYPPPKAWVSSVVSIRVALRSTLTLKPCWCAGRLSTAMALDSQRRKVYLLSLKNTWATPYSVVVVLSWLCPTVATWPTTASPIAGVQQKTCAMLQLPTSITRCRC